MLFNSRAVSLIIATLVSILVLSVWSFLDTEVDSTTWIIVVTMFLGVFLFCFLIIEFLVFRELRKIYDVFVRFKGANVFLESQEKYKLNRLSQELFIFANSQEQEIEKLKRLESFRREFLSNISHELKTPIFAAQGYLHTLLDGALEDENVRDRFLDKAVKSLDHLDVLIQDLVSISQLETGEVRMEKTSFDMKPLVLDIFDELEGKAGLRQVTFENDYNLKKEYAVYADRSRIFQVMRNLIDNAVKYGKEGGVVKVTLKPQRDEVMISVSDDGPGIPAEHQSQIFQRFFRVDKSRSKLLGGTGLGLAIVKHILEAHDSSIALESKQDKGTKFYFKLTKGDIVKEQKTEV